MKKVKIFKSGVMVVLILMVFTLFACGGTPKSVSSAENIEAGNETLLNWTEEKDCTICHNIEATSLSNANCQINKSHSNITCIQCHTAIEELAEAHSEVSLSNTAGTTRLTWTDISKESCLACHQEDYSSDHTSDVTALTDANGTIINPHNLPINDEHAEIVCADCHTMHTDDTIEDTASSVCLGCHHENVYECNTCH